MSVPDVLADRYASRELVAIWQPEGRIVAERELWLAVLEAQSAEGAEVPDGVLDDYRAVLHEVDLASIRERERVNRHDVKARIEEFDALAGHELVHRSMTSRDLTENVEQLQLRRSLDLVRTRALALAHRLAVRADETAELVLVGRSHNVPAQVTTFGKRLASLLDELLFALGRLDHLRATLPLRGLKGPVGTQQDFLDLVGDPAAVDRIERAIATALGFDRVLDSVGQIYPRSLDLAVVETFVELSAAPANLSRQIRLMAGHELATEGFTASQVGSSAMPHKMNARTCERIDGLAVILKGHLTMAAGLSGGQWNEGDVACSVVRRVVLPGACFAIDGLLQAALHVAADLAPLPGAIDAELRRELPFVGTTRILSALVAAGLGRETAHELIRGHAVASVAARRAGEDPDLLGRLAADPTVPLDRAALDAALTDPLGLAGRAPAQVEAVVARVAELVATDPAAASYQPDPLL